MLVLEITVVPQSGRSALVLDKSRRLRCFVKAAPEKGKANDEVVNIIATALKIPKGNIEIVVGHTSRKKVVRIHQAISYEQFLDSIGYGVQSKIVG